MYSAASPRLMIHSAMARRLDAEGHVLGVDGAGGVVVAADAADTAGDEVGVARVLALHEDAVAAEDRRGAVALGDLPVGEVDLGVDAEAAHDPGDRVPGHLQASAFQASVSSLSVRPSCFQVPAIGVIGSTGSLGGHHRCAQRRLRRAFLAESGAIVRLLQPLEDLPADAHRRFLRLDIVHLEEPFGVVVAVFVAELEAALRDQADSAPLCGRRPRTRPRSAAATPGCHRAAPPERTGFRPPRGRLRAAAPCAARLRAGRSARSR